MYRYVKKFTSFYQALKKMDTRKLVPFFCLTVYNAVGLLITELRNVHC